MALNKIGVPFGTDGGIHTTKTSHKKYYLTENKKNLELLDNVQKELLRVKR